MVGTMAACRTAMVLVIDNIFIIVSFTNVQFYYSFQFLIIFIQKKVMKNLIV
jgi:hypothetical protein